MIGVRNFPTFKTQLFGFEQAPKIFSSIKELIAKVYLLFVKIEKNKITEKINKFKSNFLKTVFFIIWHNIKSKYSLFKTETEIFTNKIIYRLRCNKNGNLKFIT